MPKGSSKPTTIPDRVEAWLRRIFIEDWSLKLLALTITLALWFFVSARQAEREVLVDPRIQGKPAPAFAVKEVVVIPNKVKLQGPADRLNAIDRLPLPVSVEGRRESFDARVTTLPISDPQIEALGEVQVHVTIVASETPATKSPNVN